MIALLAALLALSPAELHKKAAPGLAAIRPEAIAAHVRFLADDLLEGRRSGERGHAVAERYVAAQFEALGLRPAGEHGGWLQEVRLREKRADPARSALSVAGGPALRPFEDYLPGADASRTEVDIDAPLVFVGYGIRAPELGHDDIAGIDVGGKIVVWLQGAPGSPFSSLAKAVYSDNAVKWPPLADRGALGILALITPERLQIQPFERAARAARRGTVVSAEAPPMPPVTSVPPTLADALLSHAGTSLSEQLDRARTGKLRPFDLGIRARIRLASAASELSSHNVLGLLPATQPGGEEMVAVSAHLDHLGIGDPVDGDAIYNGAVDNATGIAEMLEIARALAAQPHRKRAVLFLAVTGEELGLHGSAWFTRHPTVPLQNVVANLNLDQLSPMWTPHDVVLRGAEQSTLEEHVRAAAAVADLSVSPDPVPEQTFFVRSDQYNFARHGVPAACLWQGFRDGRGGSANEATFRNWRATRYHQPSDDLGQPLDWAAAAAWARFEFLVALSVVQADARPAWKPEDFFTRFLASHRPP